MRRIIVSIDGPARAGKSTVAKTLARRLGYSLLDTGAIDRAVALVAQRQGIAWTDAAACAEVARALDITFDFVGDKNHVFVAGEDVSTAIRTPENSQGASQVSAHPPVRTALLDLQRRLGEGGGVVVEGRDTGTVVFPHAQAKFFLTATEDERARRQPRRGSDEARRRRGAGRLLDANHRTGCGKPRTRGRGPGARRIRHLVKRRGSHRRG